MSQQSGKRNLSGLQKSILQWLYTDQHRRQSAGEAADVPYTDILLAVAADKVGVTLTLRQLMRKGLVLITLPRGSRTRCVILTEQGKGSVQTLTTDKQKPGAKGYLDDFAKLVWDEKRQRLSARREQKRTMRQKREERRPRRRDK